MTLQEILRDNAADDLYMSDIPIEMVHSSYPHRKAFSELFRRIIKVTSNSGFPIDSWLFEGGTLTTYETPDSYGFKLSHRFGWEDVSYEVKKSTLHHIKRQVDKYPESVRFAFADLDTKKEYRRVKEHRRFSRSNLDSNLEYTERCYVLKEGRLFTKKEQEFILGMFPDASSFLRKHIRNMNYYEKENSDNDIETISLGENGIEYSLKQYGPTKYYKYYLLLKVKDGKAMLLCRNHGSDDIEEFLDRFNEKDLLKLRDRVRVLKRMGIDISNLPEKAKPCVDEAIKRARLGDILKPYGKEWEKAWRIVLQEAQRRGEFPIDPVRIGKGPYYIHTEVDGGNYVVSIKAEVDGLYETAPSFQYVIGKGKKIGQVEETIYSRKILKMDSSDLESQYQRKIDRRKAEYVNGRKVCSAHYVRNIDLQEATKEMHLNLHKMLAGVYEEPYFLYSLVHCDYEKNEEKRRIEACLNREGQEISFRYQVSPAERFRQIDPGTFMLLNVENNKAHLACKLNFQDADWSDVSCLYPEVLDAIQSKLGDLKRAEVDLSEIPSGLIPADKELRKA